MYITFFWAILLFFTPRVKNRAKNFLGIFMLTAFILYLSHAIFFHNYRNTYMYFDVIYVFTSLSVYPLYFLYIKLLTVEKTLIFRNFYHLIPAIIFAIGGSVIYLLMTPAGRIEYVNNVLFKEELAIEVSGLLKIQKWIYVASRFVFTFQIIYYLVLGSKLVVMYNKRIENFYSNLESRTIVWVNLLLTSFVATSLISITFNTIGKAIFFDSTLLLLIPSAIFSLLLFIIGLQGYMQNYTVVDLMKDETQLHQIKSSSINKEKLKDKLLKLFVEDKIFTQNDLKITQLCLLLKTNRTYISNVINSEFLCSFNDFVNSYRIDEAKRLLAETNAENYSLEHISEVVGFGSLHTFIRVFKNVVSTTPGRYRDNPIKTIRN